MHLPGNIRYSMLLIRAKSHLVAKQCLRNDSGLYNDQPSPFLIHHRTNNTTRGSVHRCVGPHAFPRIGLQSPLRGGVHRLYRAATSGANGTLLTALPSAGWMRCGAAGRRCAIGGSREPSSRPGQSTVSQQGAGRNVSGTSGQTIDSVSHAAR